VCGIFSGSGRERDLNWHGHEPCPESNCSYITDMLVAGPRLPFFCVFFSISSQSISPACVWEIRQVERENEPKPSVLAAYQRLSVFWERGRGDIFSSDRETYYYHTRCVPLI